MGSTLSSLPLYHLWIECLNAEIKFMHEGKTYVYVMKEPEGEGLSPIPSIL